MPTPPGAGRDALENAVRTLARTPAPALLADPLEYLAEEHFRQRCLCQLLDAVANDGRRRRAEIRTAVAYFRGDFALHVRDEQDDLFPMLRSLAAAEDAIDALLDSLTADHARDASIGRRVVSLLEALLERDEPGPGLDADASREIAGFSGAERRHLMLENAIVLPLARIRLDAAHRRLLSARMAARRAVPRAQDPATPRGEHDAR
ncbi:MAG: hemerythrin domain-containing protein [Lautropia sp.]